MKKWLLTLCVAPLFLIAAEKEETEKKDEPDLSKVSESFGHLIGKNLNSLGFELDLPLVVQGLQASLKGEDAPLNEAECMKAISLVQETAFQNLAEKNLKTAEDFLAKQAKEEGIISLEEGKLLYRIEKKGEGAEVEKHHTPIIRYTGRYTDGNIFGQSQEDEMISLEETIKGFQKGILGMKEGEKRVLYIHPELGYGTQGYLPPNSALAFEIEVVKANAPKQEEEAVAKETSVKEDSGEVALNAEETPVKR